MTKTKKRLPELRGVLLRQPPKGWRFGEIVEHRNFKKNVGLQESARKALVRLANTYKVSQNTIINAAILKLDNEVKEVIDFNRSLEGGADPDVEEERNADEND